MAKGSKPKKSHSIPEPPARDPSQMRLLITGICGFVGSTLALAVRKQRPDAVISGIDNFSRTGSETNRRRLRDAEIIATQADVRCASDFETLPDCDWIIDAAANPSVLAGISGGRATSRQLMEHNLLGAVNLLEFAKRSKAGFILLSSNRVYNIPALTQLPLKVDDQAFVLDGARTLPTGLSPHGIAETFSTAPPVSLYGATKLASETIALEYGQAFGFPVIVNRCGVLAGETQFGIPDQGIFSFWIRMFARRRPLKYLGFGGDGHQVRDALHPNDLAELLLRQIDKPQTSCGRIWNVGGGTANAMSLAQLSRWCEKEFGQHTVERDGTPRPFDVPWMVMDNRAAEQAFGWKPQTTLVDILSGIADHHRQNPHWLELSGNA
jgi:CDP-paratose 2-epimerase